MEDIVIFCRVSTQIQDYDRQISELTRYASKKGWNIRETFAEKISGAKTNSERIELTRLMEYVEAHKISRVLVTELSRLGRNTLQVLDAIERFNKAGVSLHIANYVIDTLCNDGKVNPMSQFLITILAEVAAMERSTIKERMDTGYRHFRNNGGKVGRKEGYRKTDADFRVQYRDVFRYLEKGVSLRDTSKATGVAVNTVRKCRAIMSGN